jgi:hypothetical protein
MLCCVSNICVHWCSQRAQGCWGTPAAAAPCQAVSLHMQQYTGVQYDMLSTSDWDEACCQQQQSNLIQCWDLSKRLLLLCTDVLVLCTHERRHGAPCITMQMLYRCCRRHVSDSRDTQRAAVYRATAYLGTTQLIWAGVAPHFAAAARACHVSFSWTPDDAHLCTAVVMQLRTGTKTYLGRTRVHLGWCSAALCRAAAPSPAGYTPSARTACHPCRTLQG